MRRGKRRRTALSRFLATPGALLLFLLSTSGCRGPVPAVALPSSPAPVFRDRAEQAGLRFTWKRDLKRVWTNRDAFGAGCAFLDYDQDGAMDILLVGQPKCALFRNDGRGRFEDVSARIPLPTGEWHAVAVGDYDNDGDPDLYLAGYRAAALLRNEGGKRFSDQTRAAGLTEREWGSCAAFFDADADGRLDLLVGHYVRTGSPFPDYCRAAGGALTGCRPAVYPAQFPRLYRNRGGSFQDVTAGSGLTTAHGKVLALQFADFDNDGKTDFYLANDGTLGDMFRSLGGGRFENVSGERGTSTGLAGQAQAGMGADFADYDRNGWLDLMVSNWVGETFSLYGNENAFFRIESRQAGLAPTSGFLGFGLKFFDFQNDGWPDLVFTNGHVYDNVAETEEGSEFRQPLLLFENRKGHFQRVLDAGPGFKTPIVGRGLAVGDVDNDGTPEILVVDYDGAPLLLHSDQPAARNHWLGVQLRGGGASNRDGYGARVTVEFGSDRSFQDCSPFGSYLSSSDPRLLFGLGSYSGSVSISVRWPDGAVTRKVTEVDRYVTVRREAGDLDP